MTTTQRRTKRQNLHEQNLHGRDEAIYVQTAGSNAGCVQSLVPDVVDVANSTLEEQLVRATQGGLALVPRPYAQVAQDLGCSEAEVIATFERMLANGRVRRIAAVPNHYRLGYVANGMSVWDVNDALVASVGEQVGALAMVSHCYERPRQLPDWPYNMFAMVHGRDRDEVRKKVESIAVLLGDHARSHDVLFSTRILKKTGMRLGDK